MRHRFVAAEADRLDKLISNQTRLSRKRARTLVERGGVRVDGRKARYGSEQVAKGAVVEVRAASPQDKAPPLPERYRDDWYIFQNGLNTLNITPGMIDEDGWIHNSLMQRRCLILVSGFFVMHLYEGELYPYYVRLRSEEPFALAGIYNTLDDGFVTASLLLGRPNRLIKEISNLGRSMPVILPSELREHWLEDMTHQEILDLAARPPAAELIAHPIARELYNQNISYKSMLEPMTYQNIPAPQL